MALDSAKLSKIVGLMGSDKDGEALSALRATTRLLKNDGLDIAAVITAGLASLSAPAAPKSPLDAFDEMIKGFQTPPRPAPPAAGRRQKVTTVIEAENLPTGYFNATLKVMETRKTRTVRPETYLVLEVSHDSPEVLKLYPVMYAFGAQARTIQDQIDAAGGEASLTIKVRPPLNARHQPTILAVSL